MVRRTSQQPKHWYVIERLKTLESMELAEAAGSDQWLVRQDFETALRAMQRLGDRQKVRLSSQVDFDPTILSRIYRRFCGQAHAVSTCSKA
jgi:ribosomal protein S3AE